MKSLFARLDQTPDSWARALIQTVASEGGFPHTMLASEMRDLAEHSRPAVRTAACKILANLNQTCPKSLNPHPLPAPPEPPAPPLDPNPLKNVAIPHFLVYRCFLDMFYLLGHTAQPRPWPFIGKPDERWLTLLRPESNALHVQLAAIDQSARKVIAEFRAHAKSDAEPKPGRIFQLEALRQACEVQHMVSLQSRLGERGTLNFEAFLAEAFVRQ